MVDALMAERMGVPGRNLAMAGVRSGPAMAPCQQLAVAVLELLVADLRGSGLEARTDARASVDGGGAACWLDCLDLSESMEHAIIARLHALAHPQGTIAPVPRARRRTPVGGY